MPEPTGGPRATGGTFTGYNEPFLAGQRDASCPLDYAMAARGAEQLLTDLGIAYRPLPYYFRVDRATHDALAHATRVLVGAQERLLRHLCATRAPDELTRMFDVPAAMAAHLDWSELASSRPRMLRADIVPTDSGYYFCELNHFNGVGGLESYYSAYAFAELLGRSVSGVSPIRQLAHLYLTECRRGGFTRFVILDSTDHRAAGYGEKWLLRRYLHLMAPDLEIHYHDEKTYPTEWLAPEEARRTLVHRLITFDDTTDDGGFLVAVRDSGATFSSFFEAELKMHRRWLSLLCDPEHQSLLTEEERDVVQRYVPHTFEIDADNIDAVLAGKDELVLKRSYSYGGEGVVMGDRCRPDELRDLLGPDGSGWSCQRRVRASSLELPGPDGTAAPFYFVLGMYLFGDGASGLLVRGGPHSPVVNVGRGGGVSWAFVE
jgi:hypothetical protein